MAQHIDLTKWHSFFSMMFVLLACITLVLPVMLVMMLFLPVMVCILVAIEQHIGQPSVVLIVLYK